MRGEDSFQILKRERAGETPPHAWGRQTSSVFSKSNRRNTPTCVGKTFSCCFTSKLGRKHPHMRGEDRQSCRKKQKQTETPPHAWGRLHTKEKRIAKVGNTPTCVGKTYSLIRSNPRIKKHPHMRGEDARKPPSATCGRETPPHAWGRPDHDDSRVSPGGNTPTCVGKTTSY